ncbi:MAG: hypothetical protein ACRDOE_03160 [Streptosporangiaceae bacterium]
MGLGREFEVHPPPELVDHLADIAARAARAAGSASSSAGALPASAGALPASAAAAASCSPMRLARRP